MPNVRNARVSIQETATPLYELRRDSLEINASEMQISDGTAVTVHEEVQLPSTEIICLIRCQGGNAEAIEGWIFSESLEFD